MTPDPDTDCTAPPVAPAPRRSGVRVAATQNAAPGLPAPRTRLIGRHGLVENIVACVSDVRCVTLIGPPGVGKTRVAVAAALELTAERPVFWVDLAIASDEREAELAIASALGAPERPCLTDAIDSALRTHEHCILVLDNCEHVAPGVALLVDRMLGRHRELSVLATSRIALRLSYETQLAIPPLSAAGHAMQLFAERVRARRAPIQPSEEADAARIVSAVDGIPLALELAASRTGVLSIAELAERLEADIDVLCDNATDRSARQRSYGAATSATFALLEPRLRALLGRLAWFRGGFDVAAAEAVVGEGDAVELLEELRQASLLERVPSAHGVRFRMYECLRQQAADGSSCAERGEVELTVARHYAREGSRLSDWSSVLDEMRSRRLQADLANYRAAWTAMLGGDDRARVTMSIKLACVLASIYLARGPLAEARAVLDTTLDEARCKLASKALVGEALHKRGHIRAALGDAGAEDDLRRALDLLPESGAGAVLRALAALEANLGRHASSLQLAERALALGECSGDVSEVTLSLHALAGAARAAMQHDRALDAIQRAIALDELHFPELKPAMYHALRGDILVELGRFADADAAYDTAVTAVRGRGLTAYLGRFVAAQALARWEAGGDALPLLDEAVMLLAASGDRGWRLACRAARALLQEQWDELDEAERDLRHAHGELGTSLQAIALSARAIFDSRAGAAETPPPPPHSSDPRARLFLRMLARTSPPPDPVSVDLVVFERGALVQVRDETIDLSRKPILGALIFALAQAHRMHDRGMSTEALIGVVWQGERIVRRAALNRLRVAVCELRKVGLRDVIETTATGYRLDPRVGVALAWPALSCR